jgi:hypothetical protein
MPEGQFVFDFFFAERENGSVNSNDGQQQQRWPDPGGRSDPDPIWQVADPGETKGGGNDSLQATSGPGAGTGLAAGGRRPEDDGQGRRPEGGDWGIGPRRERLPVADAADGAEPSRAKHDRAFPAEDEAGGDGTSSNRAETGAAGRKVKKSRTSCASEKISPKPGL